jgi:hypothetical protein
MYIDESCYSFTICEKTASPFLIPGCPRTYASSSFLVVRSSDSVLRSLLPLLLSDDGGSVLIVGLGRHICSEYDHPSFDPFIQPKSQFRWS